MNNSETPKAIFFWTLVVLFWLTAATIIGYAFGYRFNFQSGIFVYAGSITLKTTPQQVDVYIDGVLMPAKSFNRLNNSFHIGGIKPGNYFLEVKAPGYQGWSKKISVHSGISTEFWNIVLTQDSYAREDYESPGIGKFFISPRKNLAAFSQQSENNFLVKIFNPGTLEMTQIFVADDYVFTNDEKENIEWSPEAHRIIIPAVKDGQKNYFIASVDNEQEEVNLRDLTGDTNLSHVRWDPKNKDVLFYMSDNKLYRLDLNDLTTKKLAAENIASYDLSPKALFYFQLPEGIVYETSFDATDTPSQITTSGPEKMNDPSYQIIVYDDDRIVFLNKSNSLYVYNRGEDGNVYFHELSNNAIGSQFSDDGKKLLFWNNHEISAYFVRKWEVQPIRNEDEMMAITKFSDTISNVQWTRDYEHALFTNNNKIKLIELDKRDHRNMMDVLSLNDNTSLLVNNFTDGKLYYTEKNDQGQNSLHAIYFPERTTFLQNLFPTTGTNTVQN